MIQKDFDYDAMATKVKKNLDAGFDIKGIKIALREEFIQNRKQVLLLEQRAVELMDQVEYMDKKYNV